MIPALTWLKAHWRVPLFVCLGLGTLVVGLLLGRRSGAFAALRAEIRAISASRDARNATVQLGAAQAAQGVRQKYADKLKALDIQEAAKAVELEKDPAALARFLEKISQ